MGWLNLELHEQFLSTSVIVFATLMVIVRAVSSTTHYCCLLKQLLVQLHFQLRCIMSSELQTNDIPTTTLVPRTICSFTADNTISTSPKYNQ